MREEPAETSADHSEPTADDLRAQSLERLDFQALREQLASHTTFFLARQLALDLAPSYDAPYVEELQRETAEGRDLIDQAGDVDLRASADPKPAIARAGLDGVLTGAELLTVAESLEVQRRAIAAVRRLGRADTKVPRLAEIADGIPDLQELVRQITVRIGPRGEVLDDATPTLRTLRRQVSLAYERVSQALTRVMHSSVGQEALQDQVVSIRSDRLVVQVKAEMRHRIPGIVHDASNSGATLFVEPLSTVDLGNTWRELALEEEREVERVLRDLSTLVGALAEDIQRGVDLVARLDLILARARNGIAVGGVAALRSAVGTAGPREAVVRLLGARHPILGDAAVPINLNLGGEWPVLVITGPNTGGKTVAMKTAGLLALMNQSGLHIPAGEGSSLPVFDGVYADVGDQQSIEQSVSTFSSHLSNVIGILDEAGPASLVLLDELGTSTDPEEGSALAKAILDDLAARGVPTIATTHYRAVAAYAEGTPGMKNASVELDPSTLKPTYFLTMGVPGRSYAMSVASQLGLSEKLMEKAQSLLEPQYLRFEDWLTELQNERRQLQSRLQEAEESQAASEALRRDVERQLGEIATQRQDLLDGMRRELYSQYEDLRRKLRRAESALSWSAPVADLSQVKGEVSAVGRELDSRLKVEPSPMPQALDGGSLGVGDVVNIRGLNLRGTVVSIPDQGAQVEVRVGNVRLRVEASRLIPVERQPETEAPAVRVRLGPTLSSMELDLRGLRADEALLRLEEFLDHAVRDGLTSVRIIHGRGTGVLRQVVRDHLTRHPLARSFAAETRERGGNGATAVELG